MGPNWVGVLFPPLHLRTETDPVSEMSCFLISRIPDDGRVQKKKNSNPVCYTPSSEPFRIWINILLYTHLGMFYAIIWLSLKCVNRSLLPFNEFTVCSPNLRTFACQLPGSCYKWVVRTVAAKHARGASSVNHTLAVTYNGMQTIWRPYIRR
jgi:hypothetical protein